MRTPPTLAVLVLAAAACAAPSAHAAQYLVPTIPTPNLQAAVAAAAANGDAENVIQIMQSPIYTTGRVLIAGAFGPGHRLTIRPSPGLFNGRAIIASQAGSEPIFDFSATASVTLQDLDILRYSTNNNDLITMNHPTDVVLERCRIGSVWSSVGSAGWSNVSMSYPVRVTVRNCILFSALYGNFDYGLRASFGDDTNELFLYNNTVADYGVYGIEVSDQIPLTKLALHNNVVVNRPGANPEPFAFHSNVAAGVTLATSHNTAFASLANAEVFAAGQRISGLAGVGWRRSLPADAADGFSTMSWDMTGPLDPNRNQNFFRFTPVSTLHDELADLGVNLTEGGPDAIDHAVIDDWEDDPRPSGSDAHTDRGADQLEKGTTGVFPAAGGPAPRLRFAPRSNPATAARLDYAAGVGGWLRVEVTDVAGRRVHAEEREVAAGESGTIPLDAHLAPGVYLYAGTLATTAAADAVRRGRLVLLR